MADAAERSGLPQIGHRRAAAGIGTDGIGIAGIWPCRRYRSHTGGDVKRRRIAAGFAARQRHDGDPASEAGFECARAPAAAGPRSAASIGRNGRQTPVRRRVGAGLGRQPAQRLEGQRRRVPAPPRRRRASSPTASGTGAAARFRDGRGGSSRGAAALPGRRRARRRAACRTRSRSRGAFERRRNRRRSRRRADAAATAARSAPPRRDWTATAARTLAEHAFQGNCTVSTSIRVAVPQHSSICRILPPPARKRLSTAEADLGRGVEVERPNNGAGCGVTSTPGRGRRAACGGAPSSGGAGFAEAGPAGARPAQRRKPSSGGRAVRRVELGGAVVEGRVILCRR